MKKIEGLKLRQLNEKLYILEAIQGIAPQVFNQVISFNSTSAYLWDSVKDLEFDENTLTKLLTDKYDVEKNTALADSIKIIKQWKEAGLIH